MSNDTEVAEVDEDKYDEEEPHEEDDSNHRYFVHCPICNEKSYYDGSDCDHLIFTFFAGEIFLYQNREICELLTNTHEEINDVSQYGKDLNEIMNDLSEFFQEELLDTDFGNNQIECYFSDRKDLPEIITNYKKKTIQQLEEENEEYEDSEEETKEEEEKEDS